MQRAIRRRYRLATGIDGEIVLEAHIAPLVGWQLPKGLRLSFSPGFGLNSSSLNRVYRIGVAYEFSQIGNWFHREGAK